MGSAVAAAIALALAVPAAAAETAPPASSSGSASCRGPAPMVDFGSDGRIGARRNAATTTIAFGRPRKDGYYQALIADGEGGNERRVAFAAWRDDRHQFPAAWHPAGELMAMLVEHDEHERSSVDATLGYGAYTDYWIVTRDGGRAWKIYALPDGFDHAITHAAFSPDGSKFAVDRARQGAALLGLEPVRRQLSLQGRRLRPAPGPHVENLRTIQPGNVDQGGEIESIALDNRTIAFDSTYVSKNLFASRIHTMDIESGSIKELTTERFAQASTFTPDGKSIVYMTGAGADIFAWQLQGADWWIMNVDGSDKRRLTFMNVRGPAQSVNRFRLAGSLSFVSDTAFFGDVMTESLGLVAKIVSVDCG